MATNDKDKNKEEKDRNPGEGTFTRDKIERNQDFSNEQNPEVEDGDTAEKKADTSSGNLDEQYHSATESGEFQQRQNKQQERENHPDKGYYDQDGHQPSAADMKKIDKDKKDKK